MQLFLFRCNESIQFETYGGLNRRLFKADEDEIFNMTGCLPKCDFFVYSSQPVGGLTNYRETNPKLKKHSANSTVFPFGKLSGYGAGKMELWTKLQTFRLI